MVFYNIAPKLWEGCSGLNCIAGGRLWRLALRFGRISREKAMAARFWPVCWRRRGSFLPEQFALHVAAWNGRARRLYQAAGFREAGRECWQIGGSAVDFIRMEMPVQAFFEKT